MTNNTVRLFICVSIFIISSYNGLAQSCDDILSNFNSKARDSFIRQDFSTELSSLDELTRCILKKNIDSYLDELNNWKLGVVDSFYVRNYPMKGLLSSFSFVATRSGKFYFMYLPLYDRYWLSHEDYNSKVSGYELKESFGSHVSLINSTMLDDFFNKEIFSSNDIQKQFEKAVHLLPVIFPTLLRNEIRLPAFWESIKETESQKDFTLIEEKINQIVSRHQFISDRDCDYLIFSTPIGFLIVDFYLESNTGLLRLNIYTVLKKRPGSSLKNDSWRDFQECY